MLDVHYSRAAEQQGSGELQAVDLLGHRRNPASRFFGGQADASSLPASEMSQCDRDICYSQALLQVSRKAAAQQCGDWTASSA